MAKSIKVSGFIVQNSWEETPSFSPVEPSGEYGHEILHRPIEVQVPVSSLAFDPSDEKAKFEAFHDARLKALMYKKTKSEAELVKVEEEIQSMLALPAVVDSVVNDEPF